MRTSAFAKKHRIDRFFVLRSTLQTKQASAAGCSDCYWECDVMQGCLQEPTLFGRSVRGNILYGLDEPHDVPPHWRCPTSVRCLPLCKALPKQGKWFGCVMAHGAIVQSMTAVRAAQRQHSEAGQFCIVLAPTVRRAPWQRTETETAELHRESRSLFCLQNGETLALVESAARLANAHQFIRDLPQGYEYSYPYAYSDYSYSNRTSARLFAALCLNSLSGLRRRATSAKVVSADMTLTWARRACS
jgi:hypothetical protein